MNFLRRLNIPSILNAIISIIIPASTATEPRITPPKDIMLPIPPAIPPKIV